MIERKHWPQRLAVFSWVMGFLLIPGCTSLNEIMYHQCLDYHETVVEGVLLPKYLESDASDDAKQNVAGAVKEHGLILAEIRGAADGVK